MYSFHLLREIYVLNNFTSNFGVYKFMQLLTQIVNQFYENKMKLFLLCVAILPITLGARLNDRFLEALTGGYDILGLATQIVSQFGCDETEQQCEASLCPNIVNKIDFHNSLITDLVCTSVCNEAQVIAKHLGSSAVSSTGVDPCTGSVGR